MHIRFINEDVHPRFPKNCDLGLNFIILVDESDKSKFAIGVRLWYQIAQKVWIDHENFGMSL